LIVDEQTGLANGIRDESLPEFVTSLRALVRIGVLFNLPTIITTSSETGPNGPTIPFIYDLLPGAKVIKRPG